MPAQRVFLDGSRPWLDAAAEALVDRSSSAEYVDLRHLTVVLPGGRAMRRLLEHLQRRAEARSLPLIPPTITTVGNLPELLFQRERPSASASVRDLAWLCALESAPADDLALVAPHAPDRGDTLAWSDLAATLAGLHAELTGEGLSFADIPARCADLPTFRETQRWDALARLQRRYLDELAALDLDDPHEARRAAPTVGTASELVLVGVAEVTRVLRAMLERVADRVTTLVLANASLSDRFDELGLLRVGAWRDAAVDVPDEILDIVDGPSDQAAAVLHALARLDGRFASDDIAVGVPDPEVTAPLAQQLEAHGVPSRDAAGSPVARSGPFRLLAALAEYLEHHRLADLAALARHPDLERHLRDTFPPGDPARLDDWLTALDRCASRHLMTRVPGSWPADGDHPSVLDRMHAALEALVAPLRADPRPLREWASPALALLDAVYGRLPAAGGGPDERLAARCCLAVAESFHELAALDPRADRVAASHTALRLALRAVEGATVPAPVDEAAVEFLGWLELPLDDSPVMIVTGLNEGRVPAAPSVDPWLPEPLRRHLGLLDHDRRYARDAYALSAILRGREVVRLVAGRRSRSSDPLAPSRLLLAAQGPALARRVLRFYEGTTEFPPLAGSLRPGRDRSAVVVERPPPHRHAGGPVAVDQLKRYLASPYTYYLEQVLNLRGSDDGARELDAGAFAQLAYAALAAFGRSDGGRGTDAGAIAATLLACLRAEVDARFGEHPRPAVRVQVEVLKERLVAFAAWQAAWAADGWRIEHVEVDAPEGAATLDVDGVPVALRGRIDRVDVNDRTGERAALDYRTADSAKGPEQTHREKGAWVDVRLPLYRHLVRGLVGEGPVRVGYITLPRDGGEVKAHLAEWSDVDLGEADDAAREALRGILAGDYWPPSAPRADDRLGALLRGALAGAQGGAP